MEATGAPRMLDLGTELVVTEGDRFGDCLTRRHIPAFLIKAGTASSRADGDSYPERIASGGRKNSYQRASPLHRHDFAHRLKAFRIGIASYSINRAISRHRLWCVRQTPYDRAHCPRLLGKSSMYGFLQESNAAPRKERWV